MSYRDFNINEVRECDLCGNVCGLSHHVCPADIEEKQNDAYWLRQYSGLAMRNMLAYRECYELSATIGEFKQIMARACIEYAQALLAEIKRVEAEEK